MVSLTMFFLLGLKQLCFWKKANSELAEFSAPLSAYLDKPVVETEDFSQSRGVIQDLHRCS